LIHPASSPNDPINKASLETEADLFRQICQLCSQLPSETVLNMSRNLAVNVIRQTRSNWTEAEATMNMLFQGNLELLSRHYNTTSGRKNGLFPFNQIIEMPLVKIPKQQK
jgi:hypothetical protein